MIELNPIISIITVNRNSLSILIRSQRLLVGSKARQNYGLPTEMHFKYKDKYVKSKRMNKNIPHNTF